MRARLLRRIRPTPLLDAVASVSAEPVRDRVRLRVLRALRSGAADAVRRAAESLVIDAGVFGRIRRMVASRLEPVRRPLLGSSLKWSAAFVMFLVFLRSTPYLFLAPVTADAGVQLLPTGTMSMLVGGVWQEIHDPIVLRHPTLLRTDASEASILFGSRGVLRMAPSTLLRIHDVADAEREPLTATLVRGDVWALGLTAPFASGLAIDIAGRSVLVSAGSVDLSLDDNRGSVTVYDRGASVVAADRVELLVTGERLRFSQALDSQMMRSSIPLHARHAAWPEENLTKDAVHREDIARVQAERSQSSAGILPTSFLYPAKRFAEEVDVLFSLSGDVRAEKRIQQAGTRLKEAVALLEKGDQEAASAPLLAYSQSIVALAGSNQQNLVQDIIRNQIAEASASISDDFDASSATSLTLLKQAVEDVRGFIPDTALSSRDIEGYVLVDRLAQIQHDLRTATNTADAAVLYERVRPYLASLLDPASGAHPLLRREAESLLASIAAIAHRDGSDRTLVALSQDIQQYLPPEPESLLITEEELAQRVQEIYDRIFLFRAPQSRYNQLLVEVENLRADPNRGRLLRRLKAALPYGMSQQLNAEIQSLREI